MKRIVFSIILIVSVLFAFAQSHSQQAGNQPYTVSYAQPQPGVHQLTFEVLDYSIGEVTHDGVTYSKINFASTTTTQLKGWAELPYVSAAIQLPANKNVDIEVWAMPTLIPLAHPMLPSRGVIYRNQDPNTIPYEIAAESLNDEAYPADIATMEAPFIVRDVRGTSVRVFPFRYDSEDQILLYYSNITVILRENNQPATNPLTRINPTPVKEAVGMYQNLFLNYEPTRDALAQGEKGDILVLTPSAYENAADLYIQWKKEMGYNVEKQVVSSGANVTSTIQTAYNSNGNLMYVQMFGDWADIKSNTVTVDYSAAPADPKMGCVAGNDNYPDIAIGRFSCSSNAQALVQVNKAINYEKTPNMDAGWRETFIGIGSSEGSGQGDDNEVDYVHIQRIYSERLAGFTYLTENGNYGDNSTATTLAGHVNAGASTIAYCGHGAETYFVTTNYSNTNVNASTNGDRLPFIVSVACVNGKFNQSGDCFAEAWLKKENGGAVVTLMSTINQPWTPPQRGQDYFYDILVGGFDYNQYSGQSGINTNEQRTHWGSIVVNAFTLALTESNTSSDVETFQTWTTFGDASLQLRTKQPVAITSSVNTLMTGVPYTTTITANGQPVEDALVCISQNDTYYSAYTNASGQVTIQHDFSAGDVLLVVTAFNNTTIYETIPCTAGNVPYLVLDSYTPDIVEYGQQPYLTLTLQNMGGVATTGNTTVTLSCNDPMLTLLDGNGTFAAMPANGGTATDNNGFQIAIDDNVPTGHVFTMNWTATNGGDSWNGTFALTAIGNDCQTPTGLAATVNGTTVTLTWDDESTIENITITDDVEGHTYGTINSPGTVGWTYIDGDGANTGTFQSVEFTNEGQPMAYIVLDASQVTGNTTIQAHSGDKFFGDAYCASSGGGWGGSQTAVQNDDWMISPELNFTNPFTFSFWARSYSSSYSSEKFYAAYSTTGTAASDFTNISNEVTTTATWTEYSYTIPANAKYVAIHCVSNDQYIFCVDDITISGEAGNGSHYNLYRDGELIASNISGGNYIDHNVPEGTHCYTLHTACPNDFESAGITECVTVGDPTPETCDAPTGLTLTASPTQLGLNWDEMENAIAYKVYRNGNAIATTPNNSYIDATVDQGVSYSYAVQTICTNGQSGFSATINGQTTTGISDFDNEWRIFPNPATQVLNVEGSNIAEISLYSAIGELVYSGRPANNHTEINVADLVRGMYLVRITTHDGQTSIKKVILN
jgi:gingipain R